MEIKYQKSVSLADGQHDGAITKVQYRTEPYEYTDVFISAEQGKIELRVSYPTVLSDKSALGRLFERFGVTFLENMTYDPERILVGKKVSFITMIKKGKDGNEYSEVIKESLRLIKGDGGGLA